MKFPIQLQHTHHKHGGRITRITSIEHVTDKPANGRSRDYWFFRGDVAWSDGSNSKGIEIAPYALCSNVNDQEVLDLSKALNDYLLEHGTWHQKGKHQGWYATNRK